MYSMLDILDTRDPMFMQALKPLGVDRGRSTGVLYRQNGKDAPQLSSYR